MSTKRILAVEDNDLVTGAHEARDMVRLGSGEVLCPECYREAVDGAV